MPRFARFLALPAVALAALVHAQSPVPSTPPAPPAASSTPAPPAASTAVPSSRPGPGPVTVSPPAAETPPAVIVSFPPAVLVTVDGRAQLEPVRGHERFQRVRNTRALILYRGVAGGFELGEREPESAFFLRLRDGWLTSRWLVGPWRPLDLLPAEVRRLDAVARDLEQRGEGAPVDPGPGRGPPQAFVVESPAELVVFDGAPRYVAVPGSAMQRAANADRDVLLDPATRTWYLRSGERWLAAPALSGPWRFAPAGTPAAPPGRAPGTS